MTNVRVKIEGADRLRRILIDSPGRVAVGVGGALRVEAENIMAESKDLVPIDTGTLRASGFVAPVRVRGPHVEVEMGYGGAASAYALAVHEHPSEHSPGSWRSGVTWSRPGTGPKYLERPALAASRGMGVRLGQAIEKIMRRFR